MVFIHAIAGSNPAATTIFVAQKSQKMDSDFQCESRRDYHKTKKKPLVACFFVLMMDAKG